MNNISSHKIDFSIIIPAYNEETSLLHFIEKITSFCMRSKKIYEIILVDDGSTDKTFEIANTFKPEGILFHVIRLNKNRGKGYAVKKGMLSAKGNICIFLNANGSIMPDEIEKNEKNILEKGYDIFVGSQVLSEVKLSRKIINNITNFFIKKLLIDKITDTQCGLIMFKRNIVKPLFSRSYLLSSEFDMEILYLAHKIGYKIFKGPVSCSCLPTQNNNFFFNSIRKFCRIIQINYWHSTPIETTVKHMGTKEYEYMYLFEEKHWWFESKRFLISQLLKNINKQSPFILDVGTGTGANLIEFEKFGKAYGFDVSPHAIQFCSKRGTKNVLQCAIEKISYKDKKFDIIICLDVLEHVANPVEVLAELRRVLKDDGLIIITVPAYRFLWTLHDNALCHFRRYKKYMIVDDLNDAGLTAKNPKHFFFIPFFGLLLVRIMRFFYTKKGESKSFTTSSPINLINNLLKIWFRMEAKISQVFGLPVGTTIYTIAKKK